MNTENAARPTHSSKGTKSKKPKSSRSKSRSKSRSPSRKGGKKSARKGSSKSVKDVDLMSPAAMSNAYYVCHNAVDFLNARGFGWEGASKKKKGKGKRKKK